MSTEREAFEAWAKSNGLECQTEVLRWEWKAWQARAALAAAAQPEFSGTHSTDPDYDHSEAYLRAAPAQPAKPPTDTSNCDLLDELILSWSAYPESADVRARRIAARSALEALRRSTIAPLMRSAQQCDGL